MLNILQFPILSHLNFKMNNQCSDVSGIYQQLIKMYCVPNIVWYVAYMGEYDIAE